MYVLDIQTQGARQIIILVNNNKHESLRIFFFSKILKCFKKVVRSFRVYFPFFFSQSAKKLKSTVFCFNTLPFYIWRYYYTTMTSGNRITLLFFLIMIIIIIAKKNKWLSIPIVSELFALFLCKKKLIFFFCSFYAITSVYICIIIT